MRFESHVRDCFDEYILIGWGDVRSSERPRVVPPHTASAVAEDWFPNWHRDDPFARAQLLMLYGEFCGGDGPTVPARDALKSVAAGRCRAAHLQGPTARPPCGLRSLATRLAATGVT